MAAPAPGGAGGFNGALAALHDASSLPSEIWRGGVLLFLSSADLLCLSIACSALLPVAAAGVRRLRLREPNGGTTEHLACCSGRRCTKCALHGHGM